MRQIFSSNAARMKPGKPELVAPPAGLILHIAPAAESDVVLSPHPLVDAVSVDVELRIASPPTNSPPSAIILDRAVGLAVKFDVFTEFIHTTPVTIASFV